jgi:hypothetical protein
MILDKVICTMKGDCTDFPLRCATCGHNKGKKSQYEPDHPKRIDPYQSPYIHKYWCTSPMPEPESNPRTKILYTL